MQINGSFQGYHLEEKQVLAGAQYVFIEFIFHNVTGC